MRSAIRDGFHLGSGAQSHPRLDSVDVKTGAEKMLAAVDLPASANAGIQHPFGW
jgi:hypothetical protein